MKNYFIEEKYLWIIIRKRKFWFLQPQNPIFRPISYSVRRLALTSRLANQLPLIWWTLGRGCWVELWDSGG